MKNKLLTDNLLFTLLEKQYANILKNEHQDRELLAIDFADRTADLLYQHFNPIKITEAGVYLMWFSVFVEAKKANVKFNNPAGWAAALEYIWYQLRDEKKSQAALAEKHFISVSTISKYIKLIQNFLN